jgi:hypothetical protein
MTRSGHLASGEMEAQWHLLGRPASLRLGGTPMTARRATTLAAGVAGALVATGATLLVAASPAHAVNLAPAAGTYVVDTTTLTITPSPGPDGATSVQDGVAVFAFDNINVGPGVTLDVVGTRPLRLVVSGSMQIDGKILADGDNAATNLTDTAAPGGPGGGAGGTAAHPAGNGPGGGAGGTDLDNGAGGGGYGGTGARGAVSTFSSSAGGAAPGGAAYGDLLVTLAGGSGGGVGTPGAPGSGSVSGGGGGGALELVGEAITVGASGIVSADGGNGAVGGYGGSGGGSGGAVRLRAENIAVQGVLRARGGAGGAGGCCGDGGGGGGGRILLVAGSPPSFTGTLSVVGGPSGTGGGTGHGATSPDATGAVGVLSQVSGGVTLAISGPSSVSYGSAATLAVQLTPRPGASLPAGALVTLSTRGSPSAPWTSVSTLAISPSGAASLLVKPTAAADYQWSYAGDSTHVAATSPVTTISVAPVVTLKAVHKKVAKGGKAQLFGTSTPEGSGRQVRLERKKGAGWATVATSTIRLQKLPGKKAKQVVFLFNLKAKKPGKVTYRVVEPSGGGLAQGTSNEVTIKVT